MATATDRHAYHSTELPGILLLTLTFYTTSQGGALSSGQFNLAAAPNRNQPHATKSRLNVNIAVDYTVKRIFLQRALPKLSRIETLTYRSANAKVDLVFTRENTKRVPQLDDSLGANVLQIILVSATLNTEKILLKRRF